MQTLDTRSIHFFKKQIFIVLTKIISFYCYKLVSLLVNLSSSCIIVMHCKTAAFNRTLSLSSINVSIELALKNRRQVYSGQACINENLNLWVYVYICMYTQIYICMCTCVCVYLLQWNLVIAHCKWSDISIFFTVVSMLVCWIFDQT